MVSFHRRIIYHCVFASEWRRRKEKEGEAEFGCLFNNNYIELVEELLSFCYLSIINRVFSEHALGSTFLPGAHSWSINSLTTIFISSPIFILSCNAHVHALLCDTNFTLFIYNSWALLMMTMMMMIDFLFTGPALYMFKRQMRRSVCVCCSNRTICFV